MRARPGFYLLAAAILATAGGPAVAQIGAPTDEDIKNAPPQFRSSISGGRIKADPSEMIRFAPPGSEPPSADPRNLNGIYSKGRNPNPPTAPATPSPLGPPAGPSTNTGDKACVPAFQNIGSYSTMIVQNPRTVVLVMEENHGVRLARMGAAQPATLPPPTYSGHSVARWDGDVLVIDTIAIKTAAGPVRHVVERIAKLPDGNLKVMTSEVGPDGAEGPQTPSWFNWRPDLSYVEDICEDFGEAFGVGYN